VVVGISLIYFLCLVFAIYQKYDDVKDVMYWLYPELRHWKPDEKVSMHTESAFVFTIILHRPINGPLLLLTSISVLFIVWPNCTPSQCYMLPPGEF